MKFRVIVADPCWQFSDKISMSSVPRGAAANYPTLTSKTIQELNVQSLAAKDSVLALWCPSSLLPEGLQTVSNWGFDFKQTWIWVKTKHKPKQSDNLNDSLAFGLGRMFRQTHEIALIGTRGKIYDKLINKSQRSVFIHPATKHSVKPEGLQDMLDIMFPRVQKLEMFARRQRDKWICIGNEAPMSLGEDIRDSINRLNKSKRKMAS